VNGLVKSILVAVDGSEFATAAAAHAIALARVYEARLVGLFVIDVRLLQMPPFLGATYPAEAVPASPLPVEILDGFRRKADVVLEDFRVMVEQAGLQADIRLEEGVPAHVIAEVGDTMDLIMMGKRGEHARWGRELLGSTTESVVRQAATPVLLATELTRAIRSALLLYDGSHAANHALKLAADLLTQLSASLRVLTVADDLAEAGRIQQQARDYLAGFELPVAFRESAGDAVVVALAELDEEPVDLVVTGKHGHSFLHNLLLVSTTEQLMRQIEIPLLLVP